MIRCVVFDFDGVLVDSNAVKRNAYLEILKQLDVERNMVEACVAEKRDGDRYEVIEYVLLRLQATGAISQAADIRDLVVQYAEQYNEICETYTTTGPEVTGASVCLPRLAQHYALYVNSATPESILQRVIQRRGWQRYFRGVLGSPRTKIENLKRILRHEQIDGSAVVFVGDGQRDLTAARACGCNFVGVWNSDSDFDPHGLVVIENLNQIERVILEHWG